jgi:hypothetical protein
MNALPLSGNRVLVALFLLFLGLVLPACSKKESLAMDVASFNSAPPELKEKWTAAAQYGSSQNYLGAATNLIAIFNKSQQLTTDQNDALNQAWMKLGNLAFAAANAGDKGATEAVLKMKATGIGERRGQR